MSRLHPSYSMTVPQYAAHRGCHRSAVTKAIHDSRLTEREGFVRIGRAYRIDPAKADAEWNERTQLAGGGEAVHYAGPRNGTNGAPTRDDLLEAQVKWKQATAKLAHLELAFRQGALVLRSEMEEKVRRLGIQCRQRILAAPKSIAPRIVGLDQLPMEKVLCEELERALNEVADGTGFEEVF